MMSINSVSLALTGSGGAGVVVAGQMLLRAAGRAGLFGLMHRSAGPQIRGGESLAMLRLSADPLECQDDAFRCLFAFDWKNFSRFMEEVPLADDSLVFADAGAGEAPAELAARGMTVRSLPLAEAAGRIDGGRANMVLLGVVGRMLGIDREATIEVVSQVLGNKGGAVVRAAEECIGAGYDIDTGVSVGLVAAEARSEPHWLISGNEAAALGALHAGVRFVAAYPITPASDVLEWMAPRLEGLGGRLVQAEDELASINMAIGASYAGVPSLTATSGPGLALMTEGLGLAVASETPVTVLDVMRGGPSTGLPTKSEQSDLNIALNGLHGDAPHIVTAPLSITDCAFTTAWSVGLSEALQTAAIVLSDQSLGQSQGVTPPPPMPPVAERLRAAPGAHGYRRYAGDGSEVSPMAIPGDAGNMYTADGLEHNAAGTPSTASSDHRRGLDKRREKIEGHDFGSHWGVLDGDGDVVLLTWGSLYGAVREAAARLRGQGLAMRTICLRLLSPVPAGPLAAALEASRRVVVIEQNHGAQLLKHLRAHACLDRHAESLARPGPLPIRPGEIVDFIIAGSGS